MGKTLMLKGFLLDKRRVFETKLKYSASTGLAETVGFHQRETEKFAVSTDHIYIQKKGFVIKNIVFLDNAMRKSIYVTGDAAIDQGTRIEMGALNEEKFWKGLWESKKMAVSTVLITLAAGAGLYHFIRLILLAFGLKV